MSLSKGPHVSEQGSPCLSARATPRPQSGLSIYRERLCDKREIVVKGSGKVRGMSKKVSRGYVLRLHTVFGVLTQSEDLISSLCSIYSSTGS